MPYVTTSDGVRLYYEATGEGCPIVFVHEFAGDYRSWEPQVRYFSRTKRCVTFSARGYPPSDVPNDAIRYSQDIARQDVITVMDHLGIGRAHIVGHSMGAYTALHVGIAHADRCISVVAAGCGWGSNPAHRAENERLTRQIAEMFGSEGIGPAAEKYANFPMRHAYKVKDPRGWAEFARMLSEHSATGSALTMLNVQLRRPTLWEMEAALKDMKVPLLVAVGDEDDACLDGSLFLKRRVPGTALCIVPRAGHTLPSEEPAAFNGALADFFVTVEAGRWLPLKLN